MSKNKNKVGRPAMDPALKKMRVTVSLRPEHNKAWGKFARRGDLSKGDVVAKFLGLL